MVLFKMRLYCTPVSTSIIIAYCNKRGYFPLWLWGEWSFLTPVHQGWCWGVCLEPHIGAHGDHGWSCHQLWPSLRSAPIDPEQTVGGVGLLAKCSPSPTTTGPSSSEYIACPADSISVDRTYSRKMKYWLVDIKLYLSEYFPSNISIKC